ncbi:unnamed protein product [Parascedosporium putredinis]|uniref:N-acetyltransferase domain-containing protein n=1 Tax=Parascedosporium putredinis TaxID=1442378 RepID=A0A9P1M5K7_9PEZI|nr:unnamed protein product [Parascedosporium putredinis]CAI7987370.1 unnamed protein product [Parascedosporium putredinis]
MDRHEIQQLTASEPLSIEEEYENQLSWRRSADKLTFIVCLPRQDAHANQSPVAEADDADARMVGDINLFLYPDDNDDDDDDDDNNNKHGETLGRNVFGEVDIMIAERSHRGRGLGRAALAAFLAFVRRNLPSLLAEYTAAAAAASASASTATPTVRLTKLVAKINEANAPSRALFASLGFADAAPVNYFGEVEMAMPGFAEGARAVLAEGEGYGEVEYRVAR